MAKPCARSEERHTICAGCVVHKSKNPGRSPACIYFTLAPGFESVKSRGAVAGHGMRIRRQSGEGLAPKPNIPIDYAAAAMAIRSPALHGLKSASKPTSPLQLRLLP